MALVGAAFEESSKGGMADMGSAAKVAVDSCCSRDLVAVANAVEAIAVVAEMGLVYAPQ
jgi:hypothetical protein